MPQVQTFRIDRYQTNNRAHGTENDGRTGIPWLLHPHRIARIQQQVGSAFQGLLHAGDDQHLIGRALYSARSVQIIGDRLTQWTVTQGFTTGQQVRRNTP